MNLLEEEKATDKTHTKLAETCVNQDARAANPTGFTQLEVGFTGKYLE